MPQLNIVHAQICLGLDLYQRAVQEAIKQNVPLSDVVSQAIRQQLAPDDKRVTPKQLSAINTVNGGK